MGMLWPAYMVLAIVLFFFMIFWGTSHSYGPTYEMDITAIVSGGDSYWFVNIAGLPGVTRVYWGEPTLRPGKYEMRRRSGSSAYNIKPVVSRPNPSRMK